ncbi:MAG: S-layer homology domain-containing protein [Solirubrobacterales bacterium]
MRFRSLVFITALILLVVSAVPGIAAENRAVNDYSKHWAAGTIRQVLSAGLMKGYAEGVFGPDDLLTRAQMAVLTGKMFHLDYGDKRFIKAPKLSDSYDDVRENQYYSDAVLMWAINDILPTGSRRFEPDKPVTRLEAAHAVKQCFQAKKAQIVMIMMMPVYEDTQSLSEEQQQDIAYVTNTGIMRGDQNRFRPNAPLTRAEAAVILLKANQVYQNSQK